MIRLVREIRQLSPANRRLFAKGYVLLWTIRLSLSCCAYPTTERVVQWLSRWRRKSPAPPFSEEDRASWARRCVAAIDWASRYVPSATCLTRALAAQVLLERRGMPATLRIGARRDAQKKFQAHAWLESAGQVIIGGSEKEEHILLERRQDC